jgi:Ca2+/Na+ antiporter
LAWDANRPVPWRRLAREAGIFLVVGGLALTVLVKHKQPGTYLGLVLGMIFYVAFVAILSKFGYQRQSIREARERRQAMAPRPTSSTQTARQRPAPTRRTSTGPSQRPNRSTKKRRR